MGRSQTEETKEKIRQARLGKPRNFSIQALENIRTAAKARKGKWTDTQKERIRQANLGKKYSLEVNASKASKGKKNGMWKGSKASYTAIHIWVLKWKGKANKCVDCGITSDKRKIEWSNVDHKYRRNLDDYVGRCVPCHRGYDIKKGYRVFGRKIV